MIVILLSCSYKDSEIIIEGERRKIKPGQWLTSIPTIQKLAGVSAKNVRTSIKSLKSAGFMADEVTKGNHRIITVNKWEIYQGGGKMADEVADEVADGWQTGGSIQEVKEGKEEKEFKNLFGKDSKSESLPPKERPAKIINPEYLNLANLLLIEIRKNKPDFKLTTANLNNWADTVRLMIERDKRDPEKIRRLIIVVQSDDFWKTNCLSMKTLREKFDRLELKFLMGAENKQDDYRHNYNSHKTPVHPDVKRRRELLIEDAKKRGEQIITD